MAAYETQLSALRNRIDILDQQFLELLQQRAVIVKQVGELKQTHGQHALVYQPQREARMLRRLCSECSSSLLQQQAILSVFREIISACRSLEQQITIGFLGPEGTFTQAAAYKHFGHSVRLLSLSSIAQVFHTVDVNNAQYGVVPIENSNEGMVQLTLHQLEQNSLPIIGEITLPIEQNLLVPPAMQVQDIKHIYSHPQSFAQCQQWLHDHLPQAIQHETRSNAEAAQLAVSGEQSAAIGAAVCAEIYPLIVLEACIGDHPHNHTRFIVIGNDGIPPSGEDKSSFLCAVRNQPGALYHLLHCFYEENIDLTRLESQPIKNGNWQYQFFIDCAGHIEEAAVQRAVQQLSQQCIFLKHLGSYPKEL